MSCSYGVASGARLEDVEDGFFDFDFLSVAGMERIVPQPTTKVHA
jgi:hypothetical protein